MMPCCALSAPSDVYCVLTTMPGATVIVHEACGFIRPGGPCIWVGSPGVPSGPGRPGIHTSTRHWRQAPTGSRPGWSQNRGISMPTSSAARMMSVPFGTDTSRSSIVRVTRSAAAGAGAAGLRGRGRHAGTLSLSSLANSVDAFGSNGQPPCVR